VRKLSFTLLLLVLLTTAVNNAPVSGFGKALDFDGTDDFVSVPDHSSLQITGSITVEAWIRAAAWTSESHEGTIVSKEEWPDNVRKGYVLRAGENGKLSFSIAIGDNWPEAVSSPIMFTHTWHHVAGTFDGTNIRVYIDGTLQNTTAVRVRQSS
jgi:hypothetical protein